MDTAIGLKPKKAEEEEEAKKDKKKDESHDEEIVVDFERDVPVLGKDASSKDDNAWDIYDLRNPLNTRRREKDAGDAKEEKDGLKMFL